MPSHRAEQGADWTIGWDGIARRDDTLELVLAAHIGREEPTEIASGLPAILTVVVTVIVRVPDIHDCAGERGAFDVGYATTKHQDIPRERSRPFASHSPLARRGEAA
jgi:hypothetical protein